MKLVEILPEALIIPALQGDSKDAVLRELAEHLARAHEEVDADKLVEVLWERERLGSTALGDGVAIPHGKLPGLRSVLAAFGRHPEGVDFESLDGQPSRIFFLLVAPDNSVGQHLKALARVSRLLKDDGFRQHLADTADRATLYRSICEEDDKH
mgnify:CR=1 FL=1